jgi:hypothetical protein
MERPEAAAVIVGVHEFYHGTSFDWQSIGHKHNIILKRRTTGHLKDKWRVLTEGWESKGLDIWEDEEQGDLIPELLEAAKEVLGNRRFRLRKPFRTRDLVVPYKPTTKRAAPTRASAPVVTPRQFSAARRRAARSERREEKDDESEDEKMILTMKKMTMTKILRVTSHPQVLYLAPRQELDLMTRRTKKEGCG